MRYKEQDPVKVSSYLREIEQLKPSEIVYIDETGIDRYLHRQYCWVRKGQTLTGQISGKKYRRIGIVGAKQGKSILAPLQYEGTMDSQLFETWFEEKLMSELTPNSVLVMDNAAFHRKERLNYIAGEHGLRIIFLPPYSPELNPIEHFWAWLKAKLRKVLCNFSSVDDAIHYCFNLI